MSVASIALIICGAVIGMLVSVIASLRDKLDKYRPLIRHLPVKAGSNYIVVESVTRNITMYSVDQITDGDMRTALDIAVISSNIGPVHRVPESIPAAAIVGVYKLYEHKNYGVAASSTKDEKRDKKLEEMLNDDQKAIIDFANKYGVTINKNKTSIRENLN